MLPDTSHYIILLFSVQSGIMKDIPCIEMKIILKTHCCQSVQTFIIKALHCFFVQWMFKERSCHESTCWLSFWLGGSFFPPHANSFSFMATWFHYFLFINHAIGLFWFNPGRQLSLTQPLDHSPPVGWGREGQKWENLWVELKTV